MIFQDEKVVAWDEVLILGTLGDCPKLLVGAHCHETQYRKDPLRVVSASIWLPAVIPRICRQAFLSTYLARILSRCDRSCTRGSTTDMVASAADFPPAFTPCFTVTGPPRFRHPISSASVVVVTSLRCLVHAV